MWHRFYEVQYWDTVYSKSSSDCYVYLNFIAKAGQILRFLQIIFFFYLWRYCCPVNYRVTHITSKTVMSEVFRCFLSTVTKIPGSYLKYAIFSSLFSSSCISQCITGVCAAKVIQHLVIFHQVPCQRFYVIFFRPRWKCCNCVLEFWVYIYIYIYTHTYIHTHTHTYIAFTVEQLSELIVLLYAILNVVYVHDFGYHDALASDGTTRALLPLIIILCTTVCSTTWYNYVTQMYEFYFGRHRQADSISPRLYRTIYWKLQT
jgi:hypothetical protein